MTARVFRDTEWQTAGISKCTSTSGQGPRGSIIILLSLIWGRFHYSYGSEALGSLKCYAHVHNTPSFKTLSTMDGAWRSCSTSLYQNFSSLILCKEPQLLCVHECSSRFTARGQPFSTPPKSLGLVLLPSIPCPPRSLGKVWRLI